MRHQLVDEDPGSAASSRQVVVWTDSEDRQLVADTFLVSHHVGLALNRAIEPIDDEQAII